MICWLGCTGGVARALGMRRLIDWQPTRATPCCAGLRLGLPRRCCSRTICQLQANTILQRVPLPIHTHTACPRPSLLALPPPPNPDRLLFALVVQASLVRRALLFDRPAPRQVQQPRLGGPHGPRPGLPPGLHLHPHLLHAQRPGRLLQPSHRERGGGVGAGGAPAGWGVRGRAWRGSSPTSYAVH